ncbi:MAG TPA: hypothetical protein PLO67_11680 [Saprospiraceae bacterium]|nr:hypothetical protein [Saprospiraceae bacterium]
MQESNFITDYNAPYDWISDLQPVFAAQESWENGTYRQAVTAHLMYNPEGPFAIACGASSLAEQIRVFRITPGIITRLGQVTDSMGRSLFRESFLNHLQRLQLRVQVNIAPEGTLLPAGEPVLTVQGPELQIRLLESALRMLVWQPTHWATRAAMTRWKNKTWTEEDTPPPPSYPPNPFGWKIRASYIGGASADDMLENVNLPARPALPGEGIAVFEKSSGEPLVQVRRLFKGNQALADLWLTAQDEETASVSKTSTRLKDIKSGEPVEIGMSRFQNLYQPVLVTGHPVLPVQRLGYLRQRTLKQMESFMETGLEKYPHGWAL